MHKLIFNLGFGRSGTTFLFNLCTLNLGKVEVWHEYLTSRQARRAALFRCESEELLVEARKSPEVASMLSAVKRVLEQRPLIILGGTTSHLIPLFIDELGAENISVIHVHRHPFLVCGSAISASGKGMWRNIPLEDGDRGRWKLTPHDPRIRYRSLQDRWKTMNPYCRCMYQWLEQTAYAVEFPQRFPDTQFRDFRSSDCFSSPPTFIEHICDQAQISNPMSLTIPQKTNSVWKRNLEKHPLTRQDWEPALEIPEFTDFATHIRYDCSNEFLVRALNKYSLPRNFSSQLRYFSRYWHIRAAIAGGLRRHGLLSNIAPTHDGSGPRQTPSALKELVQHLRNRKKTGN